MTSDRLKRLIAQIERDIQIRGRVEITTQHIGEIIMKRLHKVDQVAYIRFASVYRQFQDVASFQQELNKLQTKAKKSTTSTS